MDPLLLSSQESLSEKVTPASEKPLLDRLLTLKTNLSSVVLSPKSKGSDANNSCLLKQWGEVNALVKEISALRTTSEDDRVLQETSSGQHYLTQVDLVLDDVVPLFFQYWSKSGQVAEKMYPVYVQTAKMQHHLTLLNESGLFTAPTLQEARSKLTILSDQANQFMSRCESGECYKQGLGMLLQKIKLCDDKLHSLEMELNNIAPALHPIHARLVEIKEELASLIARKRPHAFSLAEVQILQEELGDIDSARIDGKYIAKDGTVVPGQAVVIDLLESCYDDVHELLASRDTVTGNNPLRSVYEDLIRIKLRLERMELMGKWTVKSGDLVPIQMKLGEIDNMRADGKFLDEEGNIPEGQAVLHFLLHKCYRLVYKLQVACEPVSDSLMPLYNQLITLEKCLHELVRWKVALSSRELIPYQMKLSSIDKLRVDGKFVDNEGNVPEGQGILHELLNNCYDILRQLQMNASRD